MAAVGRPLVVIVMFEVDALHGGLLMDQVKIVIPAVKPVTVELASNEFVITPEPDTFIQAPLPAVGAFPAKVTDPVLAQIVWLGPAFAIVGTALPVIITLSELLAHGGFEVVH